MSEKQLLQVSRNGGIAVITLDNPPLNLLTPDLLAQLKTVMDDLSADSDMRCAVITGSQRAFCAGADVNTFHVLPPGTNGIYGRMIMDSVESSRLPVIAAIDGYALGGGLELALACDIRIVSEEAKIGLTEANLGLIAGYGGATRLPWLIGEGNAKLMIYSADKFSGTEAKELGVVQMVDPGKSLWKRLWSWRKSSPPKVLFPSLPPKKYFMPPGKALWAPASGRKASAVARSAVPTMPAKVSGHCGKSENLYLETNKFI